MKLYPFVTALWVTSPADTAEPSSLTTTDSRSTPDPPASSITVKVTGWLLLVTLAPLDGEVMVITGATVSFTISCRPGRVEPSAVPWVPAVLVARTWTL